MRKGEHDGHHDGSPDDEEVWTFCDSWITAGYAGWLSVMFGGAALLSSVFVMASGRVKVCPAPNVLPPLTFTD